MSDVMVTYKQQNKFDKYYAIPIEERQTIDTLTTNFLQELITQKGSCSFDKQYGTTFITEIGNQVNIYKIRYLLENSVLDIKEQYGILSITAPKAEFNTSDGFLEIWLTIEYEDIAVEKHFNFMYDGIYTDKTILEID